MQASTLRLLLLLLAVSACVSLSLGAVSQSRRSVDAISAQPDTIGSSLTREFKHMARKFRAQRRSALQQQQYERQVERLLHARSLKSALRDSLMNSQIDPPTGSSQSAKNFLASLPRYDAAGQPAPKELSGKDLYGIAVGPDEEEFPKVYTDAFETEEREDSPNKVERERLNKKAQNYAVGVASTAAISLVLMIMSCVSCLCFCLGRCCCNTCGERHPTQLYNKKQVFWSRLLVVLFAAVMFALFMVGYTANIGASQGIDKSYGAGDKLVEWSVDIVTVVNSSRSILDDVRSLIKDTDSLVFGVLPNNSRVDEWISCTNDTVFGVLDVKDDLLSFMRGLNTTIAGLSNFTVLKTAVDDVILAIDALPNLNKLDSDVKAVNESLSAVPNVDPTIQQLNKTNATINSLSALPTLASGLKTLDQAAVNFSDPANNMKSLITQYENAVPSDNLINDMHRSIKKPSTTTKQYMLANITAFNNSLNAMPKVADFRATVTSLNNTINSVRSSLTLFDDVSSLQTKLNDKPDFAAMRVTIREMQTFVDGGFQNITSLRASLVKINVSLNLLPKFGPLIQTINDTIGDVNDVKNTNLSKVIANLDKLNSTFNDIKCILDVFNVVRDINSTLVELPKNVTKDVTDAEKTITDVLNNATQYRTDIEDGRNKTVDVQNALDDIPNLNDTLDNVQDVNKSVSDLPDMNKVFTQIDDMNKTLADIPELGQYLREIDNFNSSMDIGSLSDMTQTMKDINRTLNDVPELSKYLTNFENASDTISSLQPKLTQAKQVIEAAPDGQLNDNVFTAAGQGSTQTQMVALIEQLNTTIQTRENSSELISTLTKVNNTINNRPNVTKLSADIDDLESTRKQFPNIDNLMTELQDVKGVRSNTGDLDELIKGTLLKDLNKTVTDLQNTDLQETSRTLGDMQDNVDKLDLANIISSLDFEDNFEREDILDNIESIKDVVNSTTVDDMLENIDDAEEPIADAYDNQIEFRDSYEEDRDESKEDVYVVDGVRLLIFDVMVALPFAVSLLGLFALVCRRGCPAMYMTLLIFPVCAFVFFWAAIFTPLGVFFSDVCPWDAKIEGAMREMDSLNLSVVNEQDIYNHRVQELYRPRILFRYFAKCEGAAPEFLTAIEDDQVTIALRNNDLNATNRTLEMEKEGISGEPFAFRPPVWDLVRRVDQLPPKMDRVVANLRDQLMCKNGGAPRIPFLDIQEVICVNVGGSLAQIATVLFWQGLIMLFMGTCIGCRAYKRFQKKHWQPVGQVDPDMYDDDPNAIDMDELDDRRDVADDQLGSNGFDEDAEFSEDRDSD
eukprot:TRINITY_DN66371_c12_g1_i1.p1 TRINITY_DN66371_c12_g1~~TRINITY_DN66371_c12_g1_i1.p1  ORF type:complete len:1303 (-),score=789.62 TRINITY_DN66371_c12_g1_i1:88-3996(-)